MDTLEKTVFAQDVDSFFGGSALIVSDVPVTMSLPLGKLRSDAARFNVKYSTHLLELIRNIGNSV